MTSIPNISLGTGSGTSLITPPSAITLLKFTLPQLAGSMARAAAMSNAASSVVTGLTMAFDGLLNTLVDQAQSDLTFLTDIEDLADNMHSAFSGFFGGGMADLYMTQLGYAFRCNGRELIARGKVFDLAYDAGPTGGSDVVAAEAKGTLTASANLSHIQGTARNGYVNQVSPHIGASVKGSRVVHGYAICTGSQLKRGVCCEMHVEETPAAAGTSGSGSQSGTGGASSSQRSISGSRQPNAHLALRNYRDVFRLMREDGILGAIQAGLQGDWHVARTLAPLSFRVTRWRGEDYIVRPTSTSASCCERTLSPLFGLRRVVGERFFQGFSSCVQNGSVPHRFPSEIPVRGVDLSRELSFQDGGAEFPDGLAYFGLVPPPIKDDRIVFNPEKGFS